MSWWLIEQLKLGQGWYRMCLGSIPWKKYFLLDVKLSILMFQKNTDLSMDFNNQLRTKCILTIYWTMPRNFQCSYDMPLTI